MHELHILLAGKKPFINQKQELSNPYRQNFSDYSLKSSSVSLKKDSKFIKPMVKSGFQTYSHYCSFGNLDHLVTKTYYHAHR